MGQSAERAARWGWTWAGLGWAGRCWQKREGKRYLNRGVTGTVEPGERQGKNSTGKGLARVGRGGAGQ